MKRLRATGLCLLASAAPVAAGLPTLQSMSAEIASAGARATVDRLYTTNSYDAVLAHIATGAADWIAVVPALAPGTDAATAEGLTIALATALPNGPEAVLHIATTAPGPLALSAICGIPFIEPTPASVADYRARAVAALGTVTAPDLLPARDACKAALGSVSRF